MRISKKNDTSCPEYYLGGNILDRVSETNDLGIYVTSNLSFSLQITKCVNKANFLTLLDVLLDQKTNTCSLNYIKAFFDQSLNIAHQYGQGTLRKTLLL